jgi:ribonuclease III
MKLATFKDPSLFEKAFTHRSYLNETKEDLESNERLEFLGDSILSFIMSDYLYKTYPSYKEGILTNLRSLLVNTGSLASVAKELNFGKYLKLSRGEEESKGRENETLLANCFEAYIGALYQDQGIKAVREFLHETLIPKAEEYVAKESFKDPKSLLQEHVQAHKQHSPVYKVLEEEGPPHSKIFTVGVYVDSELLAQGSGTSKQKAEEHAAKAALEKIGK